jgi:hypothetical protein
MRKVVFALAAFCVVASLQGVSPEEAYPRRAIKLIVPFAAGGNTDVVRRLTASYMQKRSTRTWWWRTVPAPAASAAPTPSPGRARRLYAVHLRIGPITVSPATELPYDPLKDLAPISLINAIRWSSWSTPGEGQLAAEPPLSKSVPDGLSYGTVGAGGLMQFGGDLPRQDHIEVYFGAVSQRRLGDRGGGHRRGPLAFSTCRMRWASSPRAGAPARHHHGQAQPAHT